MAEAKEKTTKEEKLVCSNCGKEIKPNEPKKKEKGAFVHQYEKGTGPRSEICEFC
jgi:hypothetical protein